VGSAGRGDCAFFRLSLVEAPGRVVAREQGSGRMWRGLAATPPASPASIHPVLDAVDYRPRRPPMESLPPSASSRRARAGNSPSIQPAWESLHARACGPLARARASTKVEQRRFFTGEVSEVLAVDRPTTTPGPEVCPQWEEAIEANGCSVAVKRPRFQTCCGEGCSRGSRRFLPACRKPRPEVSEASDEI
jgi:hypothetical protein